MIQMEFLDSKSNKLDIGRNLIRNCYIVGLIILKENSYNFIFCNHSRGK